MPDTTLSRTDRALLSRAGGNGHLSYSGAIRLRGRQEDAIRRFGLFLRCHMWSLRSLYPIGRPARRVI